MRIGVSKNTGETSVFIEDDDQGNFFSYICSGGVIWSSSLKNMQNRRVSSGTLSAHTPTLKPELSFSIKKGAGFVKFVFDNGACLKVKQYASCLPHREAYDLLAIDLEGSNGDHVRTTLNVIKGSVPSILDELAEKMEHINQTP